MTRLTFIVKELYRLTYLQQPQAYGLRRLLAPDEGEGSGLLRKEVGLVPGRAPGQVAQDGRVPVLL